MHKQKLKDFVKEVLEVRDEEKIGDKVDEIRNTVIDGLKADQAIITAAKAELKTEAKNELKTDQATITAAKAELKTEELKTEAKDELEADQALRNEVKADQTLRDEVKTGLKTELTDGVKAELKADQATIKQQ
ncbi:hypothetical protein NPIL_74921 [Nephila pilipes]|uniref:Uncharacterized protein n=1 Tax=Nephila pilipes TaxID=299642 RepID=A0A8X6J567_NEPPI|nr:hypothetical protein NPIL_74921 [Nephila pilipes]